jgi:hypothetical protein
LALVAAAAGLAVVALLLVWRTRSGPTPAAPTEIGESETRGAVGLAAPAALTHDAVAPDPAPALTATGIARALQAIARNEQTRRLFAKLQTVGLSREQSDRVILILGTAALRPGGESPTLQALGGSGRSRALSDDEGKRVLAEREQIAQQRLRDLRPALASVLTPAQLEEAGLGGDAPTKPAPSR